MAVGNSIKQTNKQKERNIILPFPLNYNIIENSCRVENHTIFNFQFLFEIIFPKI